MDPSPSPSPPAVAAIAASKRMSGGAGSTSADMTAALYPTPRRPTHSPSPTPSPQQSHTAVWPSPPAAVPAHSSNGSGSSSHPAALASTWFHALIRGAKGAGSSIAGGITGVGGSGSASNSRAPSRRGSGFRSLPLALTGDPTLDGFKAELDHLSDEVSDVKQRLQKVAKAIVGMADEATQLALVARNVCAQAELWPASIGSFADAHEEWCSSAATLFASEFASEVLEPLEMWEEESSQFLRELQRTNEARVSQQQFKTQVDELFMQLAETSEKLKNQVSRDGGSSSRSAASSLSSAGAAASEGQQQQSLESLETDLEFRLKIKKTDLAQAATNFAQRCAGLGKHMDELRHGRVQAMDVAFTRFMTQQHFFFRPSMRIVDQMLYTESGGFGSGGGVGGGGGGVSAGGGPMTPKGAGGAINSPRRTGAASGGRHGSHGHHPGGAGYALTLPARGRVTTLEEDIMRASRRINRKSYHAQTHHYGPAYPVSGGGSGGGGNSGSGSSNAGSGSQTARASGEHHHDSDHAPDIHPSLRYHSRVHLSEQPLPSVVPRARGGDAALLDACKQLQAEMDSRRSTEETNERLRKEIELLTARASEPPLQPAASPTSAAAAGEAAEKLQKEIEDLRRKLAEREDTAKKDDDVKKKDEPEKALDIVITSPDAPPPPPMDAPPPPPPPPGPPSSFSGPGGFLGGMRRAAPSARERELSLAAQWNLPVLPPVPLGALNPPGLAPDQRVQLKKLHWTPCAPEDFMTAPSDKSSTGTAQKEEAESNVWKDLFIKSQAQTQAQVPQSRSDPASAEVSDQSLEQLALPLVPHSASSCPIAAPASSPTASSVASSSGETHPFDWRWEIEPRSFATLFAQKATAAMKRKKNMAQSNKPNKYALGREGAKAFAVAAGQGVDASSAAEEDESDDESAEGSGGDSEGDLSPSSSSSSSSRSHRRKKKGDSVSVAPPVARVELIAAKRSYNVSISLSHFRLAPELLRDALLHLDATALPTDALDILEDILPSKEEATLVQEWVQGGGDPATLGSVEQFFLALSGPLLRERLKLLLLLESFTPLASRVESLLDLLLRGLGGLRECRNEIAIVLGIILRVGNLMNASGVTMPPAQIGGKLALAGSKGKAGAAVVPSTSTSSSTSPAPPVPQPQPVQSTPQVYGFFLPSTLGKLRSVKSLDGSQTLLHFLVRFVSDRLGPQFTSRLLEKLLGPLRECARVEQAFLCAEIKQMGQNVEMCRRLIEEDERQVAAMAGGGRTSAAPTPTPSPLPSPAGSIASAVSIGSSSASSSSTPATSATPYVPLPPRVREFYSYASARLGALLSSLASIHALHSSLQSYYLISSSPGGGGGGESMPWENFLGLWASFLSEWNEVSEEIADQAAQDAKRKRQLEAARVAREKREESARIKAAMIVAERVQQGILDPSALADPVQAAMLLPPISLSATSASSSPNSAMSASPPTHSPSSSSSEYPQQQQQRASPSLAQSLLSFLPRGGGSRGAPGEKGMDAQQQGRPPRPAGPDVQGDFSSQGNVYCPSP